MFNIFHCWLVNKWERLSHNICVCFCLIIGWSDWASLDWLNDWLSCPIMHLLIIWLIEWELMIVFDWLADWIIHWINDWKINLSDWLIWIIVLLNKPIDEWLILWLTDWLVYLLAYWLTFQAGRGWQRRSHGREGSQAFMESGSQSGRHCRGYGPGSNPLHMHNHKPVSVQYYLYYFVIGYRTKYNT